MSKEGAVLKSKGPTTKSERTHPKSGDDVLRRHPAHWVQRGKAYHLQEEGVLVKFDKIEQERDLKWEVEWERS